MRTYSVLLALTMILGTWGCSSTTAPAEEKAGAATAAAEQPAAEFRDPAPTQKDQAAETPDSVLAELKAGNERFLSGKSINRNSKEDILTTSKGQYPSAAILSCVDSRVPVELVFDQGIGDVFSARVAGNIVDDEMLGSAEFATKVAGSKLIVVMGHTSCGAVKGACDDVQLGSITKLVSHIKPSVADRTPEGETCSSKNIGLVNEIAVDNVQKQIAKLRESPILTQLETDGDVKIVGAMYDVGTGVVKFL